MQYGYFDDAAKEYVITRPDTPRPWANYLGDPNYGAIITNNAGGYSFVKSGANGRILRYVFNHLDEPGRYIYLKDQDSGDYWSVSYRPVCRKGVSHICRHGLGYSRFTADYAGIHAEAVYYVPLNAMHEVWHLRVRNDSGQARRIAVTGYCEFTSENNYEQDQVNLQYSQFISVTKFHGSRIEQILKSNMLSRWPEESTRRFFGLIGCPVSAYCGDKESFLGPCRGYGNPVGIENGLSNTDNFNYTACGALESELCLAPGEERELAFLLGMHPDEEAEKILASYPSAEKCHVEVEDLKAHWAEKLSALQVETPSPEFNSMLNTWHPFNCFMTFIWSRAASLVYCGLRNGYGYRDTVQDIQGVIHLDPAAAKEKISFMLSAQVDNGAGLPLVKFTHNPGHENTPDDPEYVKETGHPAYRADDAMWLFPTVYKYLCETGDLGYLDEVIPYANRGEDSVYDHLKRAIHFTLNHLGAHRMPAGLYADWNDCLRLGEKGESVFVAMQFYWALNLMRRLAEAKNDSGYIPELDSNIALYREIILKCFDEDRFIRGYCEDGRVIGARGDREANMWLNPQSFAVISGLADEETGDIIMETVHRLLNTEYGAEIMIPPFTQDIFEGTLMACYTPGNKENSSIFQQTQGWLILAESLRGKGNRAFEYYRESCPAYMNDKAEIRAMEPYCYGQFTEGRLSPRHGRSNVHWLTGTASTVMVGCVEGILGLRPDLNGLRLCPAIPDEWQGFKMEKVFRGRKLSIHVHNHAAEKKLILNGREMQGNYIPAEALENENTVELYI